METLSLFRVLVRRWYVTLPLLAGLGAGLAAYAVGVGPTYRSAATVLVQGPAVAAVGTGLRPANPLLQDNRSVADALGAIASALSSDPVRQDYRSHGLASDYTIVANNNEVTFTVSARHRSAAAISGTALVADFSQRLSGLEQQVGAPARQLVQSVVLVSPTAVVRLAPRVAKGLTALAVVGLFGIATLSMLLDAAMSGRRRRDLGAPVGSEAPAPPLAGGSRRRRVRASVGRSASLAGGTGPGPVTQVSEG